MAREDKIEGSQPGASVHFSGQALMKMLGNGQKSRTIKAEEDIPHFLRQSQDSASQGYQQSLTTDDSLASTCLYSEMVLKNTKFTPQYPLRAPVAGQPGPSNK